MRSYTDEVDECSAGGNVDESAALVKKEAGHVFALNHDQLVVETFTEYLADWEAYCRLPEHAGTILWYPEDFNYVSLSEVEFSYWNDLYLFIEIQFKNSSIK